MEDDFQKTLLRQLISLIEGMQAMNRTVGSSIEVTSHLDAGLVKLNRQQNEVKTDILDVKSEVTQSRSEITQFRSEISQFRSDVNQRLDAVFHRLDDLETGMDESWREIKALNLELRSQYNEILNALQAGWQSRMSIQELSDRIEALERGWNSGASNPS